MHRQHIYRVLDKSLLSTVRRKRGGKQAGISKPQTKHTSATDDAAASTPKRSNGGQPLPPSRSEAADRFVPVPEQTTDSPASLSLSPPAPRYRTASVSGCQLAWQWVNTKPLLSDWLTMSDTITSLCHGAAHARCRVYSYPRRTWQRVSRSVDTAGGTRGAGPVCQM